MRLRLCSSPSQDTDRTERTENGFCLTPCPAYRTVQCSVYTSVSTALPDKYRTPRERFRPSPSSRPSLAQPGAASLRLPRPFLCLPRPLVVGPFASSLPPCVRTPRQLSRCEDLRSVKTSATPTARFGARDAPSRGHQSSASRAPTDRLLPTDAMAHHATITHPSLTVHY